MCRAVIEKVTREGEVAGSNPAGRWREWVASLWGPLQIKSFLFPMFKISFLKKICRVLFSTWQTLNGPFARDTANLLPCAIIQPLPYVPRHTANESTPVESHEVISFIVRLI